MDKISRFADKVFHVTDRVTHVLLGAAFLPPSVRSWLFSTGTSIFEAFQIVVAIGWGSVLLVSKDASFLLPTYEGFERIFGPEYFNLIGIISISLGVLTLFTRTGPHAYTKRMRILLGFCMLMGGLMWTLIAGGFFYAYPPLSTAMIVYSALAIFCYFTGEHLMYEVHRTHLEVAAFDGNSVLDDDGDEALYE